MNKQSNFSLVVTAAEAWEGLGSSKTQGRARDVGKSKESGRGKTENSSGNVAF